MSDIYVGVKLGRFP